MLYRGTHGSGVAGITAFAGNILKKPRDVKYTSAWTGSGNR